MNKKEFYNEIRRDPDESLRNYIERMIKIRKELEVDIKRGKIACTFYIIGFIAFIAYAIYQMFFN